ncbi:HLA class II histocompatibility antigen, DP beta 1 chain isoform X2 [Nycticebus coucang]|uniref:HLA class II histocompatibility antigen, DP beta 1 chain isoform X2 n=1 Tax=Nycticebus coucang TaxID=9470 RepID=UPI00234E2EDA|nr:HLA class II histocompatibility antigen, DP beta 1 chain isoform X2 [Nycticebus coucang]
MFPSFSGFMLVLQVSETPRTAALMMLLMVLLDPVVQGRTTPENYVLQVRDECYALKGTQRLVERHIYNRQEFLRFDSDVGEFQAVTELGRPEAAYWNNQKDILEQKRAEVDRVCRHNYELDEAVTLKRQDFYPGNIQVRWFLNGQEETAGVVSTNPIRNGDWTFQILVMLEMTPQQGDVYTCQVEHPSLDSPVTVEWKAQSDSARSKTLAGAGAFVLGLITFGVGLFMYRRSKKVQRGSL